MDRWMDSDGWMDSLELAMLRTGALRVISVNDSLRGLPCSLPVCQVLSPATLVHAGASKYRLLSSVRSGRSHDRALCNYI